MTKINTKFIFITGGVISSLGKGIASACFGSILKGYGRKITIRKLDPYLNIDAGTMSPIEHGEVFVTDDGGETDLDLGHYQRFAGVHPKKQDSTTSGRIYRQLLDQERKGIKYLGQTIQVIPHVTNIIKDFCTAGDGEYDVIICEIGGTVGDIEIQPFLEAIKQLSKKLSDVVYIHLTLVPNIGMDAENKTKPTQHSVKELMSHGIEPDILMCRTRRKLSILDRKKIALSCNVPESCIIDAYDMTNLYEIPSAYYNQFTPLIKETLGVDKSTNKIMESINPIQQWDTLVKKINDIADQAYINIGIAGKYDKSFESYKSFIEAIIHGCIAANVKPNIYWIGDDTAMQDNGCISITSNDKNKIEIEIDAIIVPGGFGSYGIERKINTIQWARTQKIPFLGICLGMQLAIIEFCRNVANIKDANSEEFEVEHKITPVISIMKKWHDDKGNKIARDNDVDIGGTMRLGAHQTTLMPNTLAYDIYNNVRTSEFFTNRYDNGTITERFRHRYDVDLSLCAQINNLGMKFSGFSSKDKEIPIVVELSSELHPFFIAVQFHPEFQSSPFEAHPLFEAWILTAVKRMNKIKLCDHQYAKHYIIE